MRERPSAGRTLDLIVLVAHTALLIGGGLLMQGCGQRRAPADDSSCDADAEFDCVRGAPYGAGTICDDLIRSAVCVAGTWECPLADSMGHPWVPASQCTCTLGRLPTVPKDPCFPECTSSGWICRDAPAGSDAGSDLAGEQPDASDSDAVP